MVRFLFALFNFRVYYLDENPDSEYKASCEHLTLGDAVYFVGAFGELFEDIFFFVVQPFLQIFLVPDYVPEQFRILTAFLEVPLAWADVAVL